MKVLLFLAVTIYGASVSLSTRFDAAQWEGFKIKFNKSFDNEREEDLRKQIFQKNLERIQAHNQLYKKRAITYPLGVTHFADMTPQEIYPYKHGLVQPKEEPKPLIQVKSRKDVGISRSFRKPASFDWRNYELVTPVKNQGNCAAGWAFAAVGAIETYTQLYTGRKPDMSLSEQQIIDCTPDTLGCSGGWTTSAFYHILTARGVNSRSSYPYDGQNGVCRYSSDLNVAKITDYVVYSVNDDMLAAIIASKGPVAVDFDASHNDFEHLTDGIYYNPACRSDVFTHTVLVVGYGTEKGHDYWLIKNSWGTGWGMNGYGKIARNRKNHCGIGKRISYPIVKNRY